MKLTKMVIAAFVAGSSVAAHAEGVEWGGFESFKGEVQTCTSCTDKYITCSK